MILHLNDVVLIVLIPLFDVRVNARLMLQFCYVYFGSFFKLGFYAGNGNMKDRISRKIRRIKKNGFKVVQT